jgi:uroporphyrinogen-III synthase
MSRRLLVLRPQPGNAATVSAARAAGLEAIAAPLFEIRPLPWTLPDRRPEALLVTSANAVRHGNSNLAALTDLPVYTIGAATADVARNAGFGHVVTGDGDLDAVISLARRDGIASLLHLAGRDYRRSAVLGMTIERRFVYAAEAVEALPVPARDALPGAVALLHSPRAATLFARFVDPSAIAIAAISPATLAAAGDGWRASQVAERPTDASLLAVAAKLCDQSF